MKWLLIIVVYATCSEPVQTPDRMFDTQKACIEWSKSSPGSYCVEVKVAGAKVEH